MAVALPNPAVRREGWVVSDGAWQTAQPTGLPSNCETNGTPEDHTNFGTTAVGTSSDLVGFARIKKRRCAFLLVALSQGITLQLAVKPFIYRHFRHDKPYGAPPRAQKPAKPAAIKFF